MKRIQHHQYGGSAALRLEEAERSRVASDTVLQASSGWHVTRFKVGDEVFGAVRLKEVGTLAEALEEKLVSLRPPSLL